MQTASSSLAIIFTDLNERKQQIATIEGKSEEDLTKGEGAECSEVHLKVTLEVARWGLIPIS